VIKAILRRILKNASLHIAWTGLDEKEMHIKIGWAGTTIMDRYIDVMKE